MAIWGRPGSRTSLILRFLQVLFAALCLGFIVSSPNWIYNTAFWVLFFAMSFNIVWSSALFLLDVVFICIWTSEDLSLVLLTSLVVGDWVVETFTLGATTLSAALFVFFTIDSNYCKYHSHDCKMYVIFVVLGFITWLFTAMSALIMLWLRARYN